MQGDGPKQRLQRALQFTWYSNAVPIAVPLACSLPSFPPHQVYRKRTRQHLNPLVPASLHVTHYVGPTVSLNLCQSRTSNQPSTYREEGPLTWLTVYRRTRSAEGDVSPCLQALRALQTGTPVNTPSASLCPSD